MNDHEPEVRMVEPPHGGEFEIEIRRAETPSGAPPLVLVPGVGGPRGTFHHQMREFARDRDVIATNLNPVQARGLGAIDSAARDVEWVLDTLRIGKADLLGASFGSCAVARLGWLEPERVGRMVWVVPPVVQSSKWREAFGPGWLFGGALLKYSPARHRKAVARSLAASRLYSPEPDLNEEELELLAGRASDTELLPFFRRVGGLRGWDWRTLPAPHPVPALVIQGRTEHDATPPDALEAWARLTGRPVVVIPGRHMPYLSFPQKFNQLIRAFLEPRTMPPGGLDLTSP